jgi:hypothetical protein
VEERESPNSRFVGNAIAECKLPLLARLGLRKRKRSGKA